MSVVTGSYFSTLTPLQLTTTAGLLQTGVQFQGVRVNPTVYEAIDGYLSTNLIATFTNVVISGTGILSNVNLTNLSNLSSNICAAFSDSIPQTFINLGTFANVVYPPGLTGIIGTKANLYLGSPTGTSNNWDVGRFCQLLLVCDAYADVTNQFIFSACNSGNAGYMCDTFTDMDNAISGDVTMVNLATPAFGQDLQNLGNLIDLSNLGNFGSPLALTRRIIQLVPGTVPVLSIAFIQNGVPDDVVINIEDPLNSVTDSAQKLMYRAMQTVTGDDLSQILQVLGVTTLGINTMADLLNPVKLFPLSYSSLTVPTPDGLRLIYNDAGDVNTTLLQQLPDYVISSLV
jgi:hypothetical protein